MDSLFKSQVKKNAAYTADAIEVLEGLEAVRRRPGMYIGGTDEAALHHLAREIIDNSIDEAVAGYADEIWVTLKENNFLEVRDNGRGIPTDPHPKFDNKSALEVILTTLHAGGKFSDKVYKVAGGLHGVGLSVVNALSDKLTVTVQRKKNVWTQDYSKGLPISALKTDVVTQSATGTSILFHPDPEIFDALVLDAAQIFDIVKVKAALRAGVKIHFAWEKDKIDPAATLPESILLHYPGGLSQALREELGTKTPELFYEGQLDDAESGIKLEFALCWPLVVGGQLRSFCNTIPTIQGGSHELGFRQGITKALRSFAEMSGLKKTALLTPEDVFAGHSGWLSVFISNPQFQGQTKDKLANKGLGRPIENMVKDMLQDQLIKNPGPGKELVEILIANADARRKLKLERDVLRQTPTRRLRLPGKLTDCTSTIRSETELFLVEGDSAGGSAKQARQRQFQAILPLRGKILNVVSATVDKVLANQGIQDMSLALGCGTGKKCNLKELRYGRIIIMTDADVDGAHIAALLMTFFFTQMRPVVEKGHLYLAQPPLFRITAGSLSAYAADDAHRDKLLATTFKNRNYVISRFKGLGEMSWQQLKQTTMDPKTRILQKVIVHDDMPVLLPPESVHEDGAGHMADGGHDMITDLSPDHHMPGALSDPLSSPISSPLSGLQQTEKLVDELMGKKPESRFAFIQANATYVKALDI